MTNILLRTYQDKLIAESVKALADAEAQAMAWITAELNHVCKN
ncbi:MAG TPA: hypothetical protein VL020_07060 [Pseudomonadales bacterium]|nr:hypothetical protein [Pseudomonadales bacterium]